MNSTLTMQLCLSCLLVLLVSAAAETGSSEYFESDYIYDCQTQFSVKMEAIYPDPDIIGQCSDDEMEAIIRLAHSIVEGDFIASLLGVTVPEFLRGYETFAANTYVSKEAEPPGLLEIVENMDADDIRHDIELIGCGSKDPNCESDGLESESPTVDPSAAPSVSPSASPSESQAPSASTGPSEAPSLSIQPSSSPEPSASPSHFPSASPSVSPSASPSSSPSSTPSWGPSSSPSDSPGPSANPSDLPSQSPSASPSEIPSYSPSQSPSQGPSGTPSESPNEAPSDSPSESPSASPSDDPSHSPSTSPTGSPSDSPSSSPVDYGITRTRGRVPGRRHLEWTPMKYKDGRRDLRVLNCPTARACSRLGMWCCNICSRCLPKHRRRLGGSKCKTLRTKGGSSKTTAEEKRKIRHFEMRVGDKITQVLRGLARAGAKSETPAYLCLGNPWQFNATFDRHFYEVVCEE